MGISAVVLTKNEEKNIRLCLQHLAWAEDVVVVDSGSDDATVEMAKELGARVVVHVAEPFLIAEQRNWALDNAGIHTEWVLFVDADEVITDALRKEILKATEAAPSDVTGFQLCFKFMFMGRWLKRVCRYPSWHDRLHRVGRARLQGGVWECFDTEGSIGRIHEPYLHYGFNCGMDAWIDRHQRYARCKAEALLDGPQGSFGSLVYKAIRGDGRAFARVADRVVGRSLYIGPLMRFLYHYVFKLGILEGRPGLIYSRMMAMYQFMIYLHAVELKHRRKSLPL